jgi:O-antigen ligase
MYEVIKVNPIFGLGPANYYWYSALFPILGYYVPFNSHNNYIDIIAQTGLVGLVAFIWFAWEVAKAGLNLRKRVPDGFPKAYLYGALGGLGGMIVAGMFGDWVVPFVYNVGLDGFRSSGLAWMFLGALIAMERIYHKDEDEIINVDPTQTHPVDEDEE